MKKSTTFSVASQSEATERLRSAKVSNPDAPVAVNVILKATDSNDFKTIMTIKEAFAVLKENCTEIQYEVLKKEIESWRGAWDMDGEVMHFLYRGYRTLLAMMPSIHCQLALAYIWCYY